MAIRMCATKQLPTKLSETVKNYIYSSFTKIKGYIWRKGFVEQLFLMKATQKWILNLKISNS